MSFNLYVDHQQEFIYQKAAEIYNDVQSWEAIQQIKALREFRKYAMILDFSEVRLMDLSCEHMEYVGFKIQTEIPVCIRALVVNERCWDLAETFVAYSTGAFKSMEIFEDVQKARDWIKVTPDRLEDVMQQVQESLQNTPVRIPTSVL
jgi:hypothetical protein